jgi:hypothetical protein
VTSTMRKTEREEDSGAERDGDRERERGRQEDK